MDPRRLDIEYLLDDEIDIRAISSIYIFHFDRDYFTEFECHPQLEMIYVDDGIEEVFEDDKTYILKKGEAFLHKPNAAHKDRCVSENSTAYIISFSLDKGRLDQLFDRVISLNKSDVAQLKEVFELYVKNVNSDIDQHFSDRRIVINPNRFAVSQIIKNQFELFFINILGAEKNGSLESLTYDDSVVNRVIVELIKEKCNKFSLERISKNLSYSKSYLCRHFKKKTGVTIINYFYSLKVEEAKKLLLSNKHSIEETSDLLSFESVQYFSKVFKKYCGLTPSAWRNIATKRMYF